MQRLANADNKRIEQHNELWSDKIIHIRTNAEQKNVAIDFLSNGFKKRTVTRMLFGELYLHGLCRTAPITNEQSQPRRGSMLFGATALESTFAIRA